MLPCIGSARASSYTGAKILGKKYRALDKAELWTRWSQLNLKIKAEASMYKDTPNCFKLACGVFFPCLKQVMQKCTNIHDSEPGQHLQTKLLRSRLWTSL